jgi:aldehyde dehydrogenase (NAD+)
MTNSVELLQKLFSTMEVSMPQGKEISVTSPVDGKIIGRINVNSAQEIQERITNAGDAYNKWRYVPAPKRGELIRVFGNILREYKEPLAQLVTLECGKIIEEGRGEVQEMIDICDFAVGLSRQLYGLKIASERKQHTMEENWLPLGVVGIISAFNFPVAVWAWNTTLAIVCGNSIIWKPSEKTPYTAMACQELFLKACREFGAAPEHLSSLVMGLAKQGEALVNSPDIALISATGSTNMGRVVACNVAVRFGKSLLELGGNNAVIVTPSAQLDIAIPSILFGSVGTAGQRCTSTRRLFVHTDVYDEVLEKLQSGYKSIIDKKIGDPFDANTIVGPLIDEGSYNNMQNAINNAKEHGGEVIIGGGKADIYPDAYYANPTIIAMDKQNEVVYTEVFAPILYVMRYQKLEDAMQGHNAVPQGLSSAIFTTDIREAEYFKQHSDCGIANVNIGTSGAEIGGAFGGEKETGGGRESGSDAWKNYMRRQTSTTYYGIDKPELAQGVKFE